MKTASHPVTPLHTPLLDAILLWPRQRLVPRRSLPTMSSVRLGRSPLEKLADALGFGR